MSLGDLYRKNRISLAGQLSPNRFAPNGPSNQLLPEWKVDLKFLRSCWETGESTELETDFFEWFDPSRKQPG
jgi:hypothetical protein